MMYEIHTEVGKVWSFWIHWQFNSQSDTEAKQLKEPIKNPKAQKAVQH